MRDIFYLIEELLDYAIKNSLIKPYDEIYCRNRLLAKLNLDSISKDIKKDFSNRNIQYILDDILDWTYDNKVISNNSVSQRDIFDTEIMNIFISKPSEIIDNFYMKLIDNSKQATDYFYSFSEKTNYIRKERINKNIEWQVKTEFGILDMTINLSKPEKDPLEIAALKNAKSVGYPKCLLCKENEGYYGRINHPGRGTHRIIPLSLNGEQWYLQYSPYVYYNEHCIVLKNEHVPMKIDKNTFKRLLDFVKVFPHYFLGSNADLPIVGGSILNHDHFQGGNYEFAMAEAKIEKTFSLKEYKDISLHILNWPMSVIRIESEEREKLIDLAEHILLLWKSYSDEEVNIVSNTNGIPHNTITPIARKRGNNYELDLVLRNNRTSDKYPLGIFHPHNEVHHIKKENIGLIEVMGLAVLPARLKDEVELLKKLLIERAGIEEIITNDNIKKHIDWYKYLIEKYSIINEKEIDNILQIEIGNKFLQVLKNSGVFKTDTKGRECFERFISKI
jgi:UDPglucose--hexose-1-phosphate uridylyltransferase